LGSTRSVIVATPAGAKLSCWRSFRPAAIARSSRVGPAGPDDARIEIDVSNT
jgi:hypothetical protein